MKIRALAILAGLAVDVMGSVLFVILAVLILSAIGDRADPLFAAIPMTTKLLLAFWIGLGFTLLGAYITARLSKPYSIFNALLFGIVSTLPVLLLPSTLPRWYTLLGVLTILPISLAAGYVVARQGSNQSLEPTAGRCDDHI
jgi:hypothetical protein